MGFFTREEGKFSRVARMSTIGATVLAAAAGVTLGLPSLARADDPPPVTVPTPTVPTPDPSPPKPTPKPASPPRQVSHTPAYQAPRASAPSARPAAAVKPKVGPPTKPKPKKARRKKAPAQKTTVLPRVTAAPPVGAVSVRRAFQTKPGGSFDLASLLIVLGLCFAIACFTIALVPATYVKWRPAAIFVSERQVDVTVVGLALLVAAACTLFWTQGP